ncbi:MAG: four helix bundle protein [Opitutales bacterium]|nr:four helix bundle protein [Opitutales bacterium]
MKSLERQASNIKRSMKQESLIKPRSFEFSVRVVNLYKFLTEERKEFIMSKQLLRSGTSVGANVVEALSSFSSK